MEEYALYCYIKSLILKETKDFEISYNDYDLNGDNVIGIVIKGGMTPKYRNLAGEYYNHNSRLQIVIQSSLKNEDLFKVKELISKLRHILTTSCINSNTLIDEVVYVGDDLKRKTKDIVNYEYCYLNINKTSMLGEADFKGKTSQGKPIHVMNYNINYFTTKEV